MRPSRPIAGVTSMAIALLLALPGVAVGQAADVAYADGSATTLMRGGVPTLDAFSLTSGRRDPTAGTLTLEFEQVGGPGSLRIRTPSVPGSHAAAPRTPGGAAVTWARLHGRSGARAACMVAWADAPQGQVAGSFLCPRERQPKGARSRYSLTGTFTARVATEDGVTPDAVPPILPAGTPAELDGRTVTVSSVTDVQGACAAGRKRGVDRGACPARQLPLDAPLRVVVVSGCVDDGGEVIALRGRTGLSGVLYAGGPGSLEPLGLPLTMVDPAISTKGLPRVIDQGSCAEGHLVTTAAGPLVMWLPTDGGSPVAWTLDPVSLPPTAESLLPAPSGPPASAAPGIAPTTFRSGAADIVVDGAVSVAADDLVLVDGSFGEDATGQPLLHLAFASGNGSLTIDLPGADGSYAWDTGSGTGTQGVGYAVGETTMDPLLSACQVEVALTEAGGVSGSYVCLPPDGGSASGAFVANP